MKDEFLHIENWKNESASKRQLDLNLKELSSPNAYPSHWTIFLSLLRSEKISSVYDLGCGVGSYYELLKENCPKIKYMGGDYSDSAIKIAKEQWRQDCFEVINLWELTKEKTIDFELLHMGALLDVLPNGDEALEHILGLEFEKIFISRILFTNEKSNYKTYKAYDEINTYSYEHNQKNMILLFEKYDYKFNFMNNNVFLKKQKS